MCNLVIPNVLLIFCVSLALYLLFWKIPFGASLFNSCWICFFFFVFVSQNRYLFSTQKCCVLFLHLHKQIKICIFIRNELTFCYCCCDWILLILIMSGFVELLKGFCFSLHFPLWFFFVCLFFLSIDMCCNTIFTFKIIVPRIIFLRILNGIIFFFNFSIKWLSRRCKWFYFVWFFDDAYFFSLHTVETLKNIRLQLYRCYILERKGKSK